MWERLRELERRHRELEAMLSRPARDPAELARQQREYAELSRLVSPYREYLRLAEQLREAEGLLEDPELAELAREEAEQLRERMRELEERLRGLLGEGRPEEDRGVILEIRAGTGGEEAALFAADLFGMYARYAERRGWRLEMMSASPTELGGFREVIALIQGKGAYGRLRYESGVHRVQRIPVTESQGRIHTSTATVAVLPEVSEPEVEIRPEDLRIDVFRASGPGGQHVNTTDSAVRITHLPTGLVVTCQDERSQHRNRAKAMKILRARLYDLKARQQQEELASRRRAQVGSGERSERIRTYNFPQNRVTDHRIGLTIHRLSHVLEGDLDELLDALAARLQP